MKPRGSRVQENSSAVSGRSSRRTESGWRTRSASRSGRPAGRGRRRVGVAALPEEWVPWPLLPASEREATGLLVKRAMDVVLGSLLLVMSLPILAVSVLLIKLTSPGPAFFLHTRKGQTEEDFEMIKLRTMVEDAEEIQDDIDDRANGSVFHTVRSDPRVTPVGRWLRKFSIDELPQLVNVLRGEMSLVGPRPLMEDEVPRLPPKHRWARARHKPGLTCLWQISGRNECPDRQRLALDQRYIDEWDLWLDVKILLMTIPAVFLGRGAE